MHQWHFVPTHLNPSDHATRALPAEQLSLSTWLSGPAFLTDSRQSQTQGEPFSLVEPDMDPELRPEVVTCTTTLSEGKLGSARFERFSSWNILLKATARLQHIAECFKDRPENVCHGWHKCSLNLGEEQLHQAKVTVIHTVQREIFADDLECLERHELVKKSSPLSKLCPFLDTSGLLRVGGWLTRAQLSLD